MINKPEGFMMIERLCEDEGCPQHGIEHECVGNPFDKMEAQNKLLANRNMSVLEIEIWNRAIEAAAKVCDNQAHLLMLHLQEHLNER